jgi:hypothetical protein
MYGPVPPVKVRDTGSGNGSQRVDLDVPSCSKTDGIRRAKPRERALSAADTIVREKRRGMMRRSTSDLRVSESSDREPSQPQRGQQEIL